MNTIEDFVALVNTQLGLSVTADDVDRPLNDIDGWDSVHMIWILTILEREVGVSVAMSDLLAATSLSHIYRLTDPR